MKYVEFFAGIGGFRLAFDGAGHECVGACEIDPFARRVYVHRFGAPAWFPTDMNDVTADEIPESNCWVGGSPCQSFSVSGLREGLNEGSKSSILIHWLNLLRARRPRWFVLENVPGLLTSSDRRDFGVILATLDDIGYRVAWRVLDAQFAGVPQRRRRIALVAGLGDGANPEPVLFERAGGFWNLEARGEKKARSAGKTAARVGDDGGVAAALTASDGHHGRRSPRGDGSDNLIVSSVQGGGKRGHRIDAESAAGGHLIVQPEERVAFQCHGSNVGPLGTLRAGNGNETGGVPFVEEPFNIVGLAQSGKHDSYPTERTGTIQHKGNFPTGNEAGTVILTNAEPLSFYSHSGLDQVIHVNETPTVTCAGGSKPPVVLAFSSKDNGADVSSDISPTLRAAVHSGSHENGGAPPAIQQVGKRVRRLTPLECERLQAFQDGHSCLCGVTPYSTAGCTCSDGPRYRVLGNAIAVVVFRKVAERMPR